jgi:hypothetical protein
MINQIIGLDGPHVGVISHLLKLCGFYFNESSDQDDLATYAKNDILFSFYGHVPCDAFDLDQSYINELFGFLRKTTNDFSTNNFRDIVCTQYLLNTPFVGRVIYVNYAFEDLKNSIGEIIEQNFYEQNKQQLEDFINKCKDSNWQLVEIDYKQFTQDYEYRKTILESLSCNISIIEHLWKKINKESEITKFDDLMEKYNDLYIKRYVNKSIEKL